MQLTLFDVVIPCRTRPIGRYFGGKASPVVREWIGGQLPTDAKVYVEPFSGLWSMGLWRSPSPREIYNDRNPETVALVQAIRDDVDPLIDRLNRTDWNRETYQAAVATLRRYPDPCAAMVRCCLGFVGGGVDGGGTSQGRINRYRDKGTSQARCQEVQGRQFDYLRDVSHRLQNVEIWQTNAPDLIQCLDSPDALFYVDPPYTHNSRGDCRYGVDFSDSEQIALLDLLCSVKGRVALSGYDNPLYNEVLDGWYRSELTCRSSGRSERTEILWRNYDATN